MDIYMLSIEEAQQVPPDRIQALMPRRWERAGRYRFEKDRWMCLAAGLLLHEFLSVPEAELCWNAYGKPYLPTGPYFSLSHAGGVAVLVTAETPVGVDIEVIGAYEPLVAKRVFTPSEREWVEKEPVPRFYWLWSIKESILKAVGDGFAADPASLEVPIAMYPQPAVWKGQSWHYAFCTYQSFSVAAASCQPITALHFHPLQL